MKKRLALILAAVLVLSMFAGCGSTSTSTSEEESTSTSEVAQETAETSEEAEEVSEEAEEVSEETEESAEQAEETAEETEEAAQEAEEAPAEESAEGADADTVTDAAVIELPLSDELVTLTYMTTVMPNNSGLVTTFQECSVWNELEELTNVRIDATLINAQEGQAKFNLMISSGSYTDFLDSVGSNYSTGLAGALDDEVIVDLTDLIDQYMPNYSAIIQSDEEFSKGSKLDDGRIGMIYALTPVTDTTITSGPTIRQDWLDELGLDTPVTYDDLHDVLVAFQNAYGASMWIPYSGSPMGNYLGAGFGISTTYMTHMSGREPFYHVGDEVLFGPMQDEYYDYLELMSQWYEEGLIWSDFTSYTEAFNNPPSEKVVDGTFGVWFGESSNWQDYTAAAVDEDFRCVAFSDPVQEEGDVNHLRTVYEHITNGGMSISTQCEEFEIAAKFLDYLFTEEGRMLTTFGVEGEAWEYDEEGHPQYTDLILNNSDGYTESQAAFIYGGGCVTTSYEHPLSDYLISTDTEDQLAASDIWGATSDQEYYIPALVSMTTDENETYSAIMSDVGTLVSEWSLKVITGAIELTQEEFDAMREDLVAIGIEEATQLKQDAYTRYLAR